MLLSHSKGKIPKVCYRTQVESFEKTSRRNPTDFSPLRIFLKHFEIVVVIFRVRKEEGEISGYRENGQGKKKMNKYYLYAPTFPKHPTKFWTSDPSFLFSRGFLRACFGINCAKNLSSLFSPFSVSLRAGGSRHNSEIIPQIYGTRRKTKSLLVFFSFFHAEFSPLPSTFVFSANSLSRHLETTKVAVIERDSAIYLPGEKKSILTTPRRVLCARFLETQ